MNRTTRLAHPPVLYRGTKPIVYGRGIPAPWNSHALPTQDPPSGGGSNTVPPTPTSSSSTKDHQDRDKEIGGTAPSKPLIPDAQLFATWEHEPKDYKLALLSAPGAQRHRGSVAGPSSRVGGSGTLVSPTSATSAGVISLPLSAGARTRSSSKLG
jgi:Wiskott-Aldrich syndrome protein